ncbi:cation diffusion facilitator family transporter [Stakelama pacifica]|uniref:Cation diffusion facilitator family transporter n=1 Tax=Stakelama pacifica TaxID=517720 RepID=A0A4V3BT59_9SPHN|nr:cation diffusion facilitator family transporter [Stakelama pacifica]TDN81718.1 cation diffusion facilitator family transporter [Stakelama pacifica]GGO96354.1 cation transporter [Stakelama pacifica]
MLAANIGIAVAKFIAAALSGSSSMLTEGFHSVVDSGNQILLLYGEHRAKKLPDEAHPFGYGRELYFWAFVVAILIFAIGAGFSIYEGYRHIKHPSELEDATLSYIVLGVAFLMEGASWGIAVKEFAAAKGDLGWWQAVRESKDPSGFVVLFEDSAACAGLVVAALGIFASHYFGDARIDGVASIVIGLILGAVALLLAREAKGLLIGERADSRVVEKIRSIVGAHEAVVGVNHVRTIHTSPDGIFAAVSADFEDSVSMGAAETIIEEIEDSLRVAVPQLTSIYIRPEKREDAAVQPRNLQDMV